MTGAETMFKTILLSELESDLRGILNLCADSGEALVVELPGHGRVAIQLLDADDSDSLVAQLLESNPAFQAMVAKSKASPRKPFATSD